MSVPPFSGSMPNLRDGKAKMVIYSRPRVALPSAASSVTFGCESMNSKVLLKTDEAFCYFHENGLDF